MRGFVAAGLAGLALAACNSTLTTGAGTVTSPAPSPSVSPLTSTDALVRVQPTVNGTAYTSNFFVLPTADGFTITNTNTQVAPPEGQPTIRMNLIGTLAPGFQREDVRGEITIELPRDEFNGRTSYAATFAPQDPLGSQLVFTDTATRVVGSFQGDLPAVGTVNPGQPTTLAFRLVFDVPFPSR